MEHECEMVYKTTEMKHPGVAMVMNQGKYNLAGPIKVLTDGNFPEKYGDLYKTPIQTRAYFIDKGSVAINGISLTINKHLGDAILINIIPHTLENTALAKAMTGDKVNIEIDMVAKYIVGAGDVYKR